LSSRNEFLPMAAHITLRDSRVAVYNGLILTPIQSSFWRKDMIRVKIGETLFEVENIDDAIELHRQLSGFGEQPQAQRRTRRPVFVGTGGTMDVIGGNGATHDTIPTSAKFAAFVKSLNANGKNVILALLRSPDGLMTDDLAREIGVTTYSLPPIIRHVRTTAVQANLKSGDVINRRQLTEHGKPKSRYLLGKDTVAMLREAMK
jgi:hypothetical protein